jgi:hypothetical protein
VVAAVFSFAWATIVWLSFMAALIVAAGFDGIVRGGLDELFELYGYWLALGLVQGAVVAAVMSLTGGRWTVDTFPRWLSALVGAIIGAGGFLALVVYEQVMGVGQLNAWAWGMAGMMGAIGATSSLALLTVARRGALPQPPDRGQLEG